MENHRLLYKSRCSACARNGRVARQAIVQNIRAETRQKYFYESRKVNFNSPKQKNGVQTTSNVKSIRGTKISEQLKYPNSINTLPTSNKRCEKKTVYLMRYLAWKAEKAKEVQKQKEKYKPPFIVPTRRTTNPFEIKLNKPPVTKTARTKLPDVKSIKITNVKPGIFRLEGDDWKKTINLATPRKSKQVKPTEIYRNTKASKDARRLQFKNKVNTENFKKKATQSVPPLKPHLFKPYKKPPMQMSKAIQTILKHTPPGFATLDTRINRLENLVNLNSTIVSPSSSGENIKPITSTTNKLFPKNKRMSDILFAKMCSPVSLEYEDFKKKTNSFRFLRSPSDCELQQNSQDLDQKLTLERKLEPRYKLTTEMTNNKFLIPLTKSISKLKREPFFGDVLPTRCSPNINEKIK